MRVGQTGGFFTPEGGFAIRLTNKTGATSVKGSLIEADDSIDKAFKFTEADTDDATGIVYESGIPDGGECWIVVNGIADVLLEDASASGHGNWVRSSITQIGRVDATNAAPPGGTINEIFAHLKEVGHSLETVAGGTDKLMRMFLHFN